MQYFLKWNLENRVQLSPLQACEMDSSSLDYTSTERKLLQLYLDWMQHTISFVIPTRLSGVHCMESFLDIWIFTYVISLLGPTG